MQASLLRSEGRGARFHGTILSILLQYCWKGGVVGGRDCNLEILQSCTAWTTCKWRTWFKCRKWGSSAARMQDFKIRPSPIVHTSKIAIWANLPAILPPQTGKQDNMISKILARWRPPKIAKLCKISQDGLQNFGPKQRAPFPSTI